MNTEIKTRTAKTGRTIYMYDGRDFTDLHQVSIYQAKALRTKLNVAISFSRRADNVRTLRAAMTTVLGGVGETHKSNYSEYHYDADGHYKVRIADHDSHWSQYNGVCLLTISSYSMYNSHLSYDVAVGMLLAAKARHSISPVSF